MYHGNAKIYKESPCKSPTIAKTSLAMNHHSGPNWRTGGTNSNLWFELALSRDFWKRADQTRGPLVRGIGILAKCLIANTYNK